MKTKPLIKNQRSIEQTREDLKNTNSILTGRQLLPDHSKIKVSFNDTRKRKDKSFFQKNNHQPQDDDSEENYYEPMTDPPNYRRNSNASEQEPYYSVHNNKNMKN